MPGGVVSLGIVSDNLKIHDNAYYLEFLLAHFSLFLGFGANRNRLGYILDMPLRAPDK